MQHAAEGVRVEASAGRDASPDDPQLEWNSLLYRFACSEPRSGDWAVVLQVDSKGFDELWVLTLDHSRQDQLHIDLFVFFSVFFSCFFLFLSVVVVIWKVKQTADMRRAR
jgi:hypothetical protein